MEKKCSVCKTHIEEWNKTCRGCGFHLVLEPEEAARARYLRGPSLGALLFTQGWTFGARLYGWFLLSLVPVFGLLALFFCLVFGRRWSWKHGGWANWEEFQTRMRTLDYLAMGWIGLLVLIYFLNRLNGS